MKKYWKVWIIALLAFNHVDGQQADLPDNRMNVLLIMADDLNATLTSYGTEGVITPNLDKLAKRGMRFDRAYSQAPLCNPSRASIMTGQRPHNLRIWNNDPHFRGIYPRIKTLPQYFKEQGYHTVGIGKIYHNWAQAIEGDPQSWSEPERYHWAVHYQDWYVAGRPYKLHTDLRKGPAVQQEDVPDEAYLDGRIANAAIKKLRELRETSFLLAVGFWKPHLPYNAPKKYWDLYERDKLPQVKYWDKAEGVPDIAYVDSDEARSYTDIDREGPIPASKKRELRHGYLASISYLDEQIGKLIDELERLDLEKKTIIVFTSDHGYHAGEHGQFGKWTNFEVGSRVPFIISAPGIGNEGESSGSIVELVDIYPTLLDLCDLKPPQKSGGLDGISLISVLKNSRARVKSAALSQIARPLGSVTDLEIIGSSIRSHQYRYNVWVRQSDGKVVAEELYDLSDSIFNAINLVNNSRYKKIRKNMIEKLKEKLGDKSDKL